MSILEIVWPWAVIREQKNKLAFWIKQNSRMANRIMELGNEINMLKRQLEIARRNDGRDESGRYVGKKP